MNSHLALADLIPIRAQRGSLALVIALHHSAARVWICVCVELFKERVNRVTPAKV